MTAARILDYLTPVSNKVRQVSKATFCELSGVLGSVVYPVKWNQWQLNAHANLIIAMSFPDWLVLKTGWSLHVIHALWLHGRTEVNFLQEKLGNVVSRFGACF